MVIIRTPLRLPIAGGGTDLPIWYEKNGSLFISAAIDKYIYTTVHRSQYDKTIRLRYSKFEETENLDELQNEIFRETLKFHGIKNNIELTTYAEIPSGTGLGSSGTFGVGISQALHTLEGNKKFPVELAEETSKIQMDILKFPIGKQDQYVAAYGGFNVYQIDNNGKVEVNSLNIDYSLLEKRLVLFFTGFKRDTNEILKKSTIEGLDKIQELAFQIKSVLEKKQFDDFGYLMNEHWEFKKKRGDMTNPQIDEWYNLGLDNGALGGKLVGAGGGGFLLFYTKYPEHLINIMIKQGLQYQPFKFDFEGSKIIND